MEEKEAQFKIIQDKYILVTGSFEIVNSKGELLTNEGPAYLCRCGQSQNKPFCDGKHRTSDFKG